MDNKSELLPPIVEVFREIYSTLRPNSAKLQIESQQSGEEYVRLIPTNPGAAPIAARGGGNLRYELILGKGTIYEIMPNRKQHDNSPIEMIRDICSAIFKGDFEETVYTVGDKMTKTTGKLNIKGKVLKSRAIHGFYPLIPKKKTIIKYAPYN